MDTDDASRGVLRRQHLAAEAEHGRLEGEAGAGARLVEDGGQDATVEPAPGRIRLQLRGRGQQAIDQGAVEVGGP